MLTHSNGVYPIATDAVTCYIHMLQYVLNSLQCRLTLCTCANGKCLFSNCIFTVLTTYTQCKVHPAILYLNT